MTTHVLVVGGTGMLRSATLELARRAHDISLIARTPARLAAVHDAARDLGGAIHPIALDYRDTTRLTGALEEAITARGPIQLALCWVHSTAPDALPAIAAALAQHTHEPARLFHVRGMPGIGNDGVHDRAAQAATRAGLLYRRIQLGFVIEGARSRWLTDDEISAGAIAAIDADAPCHTVGVTEPLDRVP